MNNKMRFLFFVAMTVMMVFVSCSQDASGDSDDSDDKPKPTVPAVPPVTETPPPAAPKAPDTPAGPYTLSEGTLAEATSATVAGTWVQTSESKTEDESNVTKTTWIFDGEGGYTNIVESTIVPSEGKTILMWNGSKGTFEISDGVLRIRMQKLGDSGSSLYDPATAEWEIYGITRYDSKNIAFIDGKLCVGLFRRVGTGTGITGSWEAVSSSEFPPETGLTSYHKSADTFTETGYDNKYGDSKISTFDDLTWASSEFGTYAIGADNTITFTGTYALGAGDSIRFTMPLDPHTSTVCISGNCLYFGSGCTKTL